MNKKYQLELSFFAVGPQRTGSTWLHKVMENHPAIGLPVGIKETMFFDKFYHKGINWLLSHYDMPDEDREYGEVAPTYFASDIVMNRIKSHYPDCKIFINIRNPVQHAYSMYLHESSKGRIKGELSDIINNSPEKLRSSTYSEWIPKWQQAFGIENVCLIWMDQIEKNPQGVYKEVCEFLGISAEYYLQDVGDRRINASKKVRFPKLTQFGLAVYQLMREYKLHSVINFCKRIHLDKVTFASKNSEPASTLNHVDFDRLLALYSADIEFLERTTGQNLTSWRIDNRQNCKISESSTSFG